MEREQTRPWIVGTVKSEGVAKLLTQVAHKMIEPGKILSVSGTSIGNGSLAIQVYKVSATTHIQISGKTHQIIEQVSMDTIRELIEDAQYFDTASKSV